MTSGNPWNIQSLYELQFFNCPSCGFKDKSKQRFIDHAYKSHSDSINILLNIDDKSLTDIICPWKIINIKKEPSNSEIIEDPLKIDELNGEKTGYIKCIYPSCSYKGGTKLFKFPQNDRRLRKKWLDACQLNDVKPTQKICYKHFNQYDVFASTLGKYHLRKGSIPIALVVSYLYQSKVWGKKKVKNLEDCFGINFYPGIKLFVSQKLQIFSAF